MHRQGRRHIIDKFCASTKNSPFLLLGIKTLELFGFSQVIPLQLGKELSCPKATQHFIFTSSRGVRGRRKRLGLWLGELMEGKEVLLSRNSAGTG